MEITDQALDEICSFNSPLPLDDSLQTEESLNAKFLSPIFSSSPKNINISFQYKEESFKNKCESKLQNCSKEVEFLTIKIELDAIMSYKNQGDCWFYANKLEDAIYCYHKADELYNKFYKAYCSKAYILIEIKDFNQQITPPEKLIKKTDNDTYIEKAIDFAKKECYSEAFQILEQHSLVGLFFSTFEMFDLKMAIFSTLKKYHDAIVYLDKLIEQRVENYDMLYYHKGVCLLNLNKYEEALECLNKVKHFDSKNDKSVCFYMKSLVLMKLKKYVDASLCFEKALPFDYNNFVQNGLEMVRLRLYENVIKCFREQLLLDPAYQAYFYKECIDDKLRKFALGIETFDCSVKLNETMEVAYRCQGVCLLNLKKYDESMVCFDKYIELKPKDFIGHYLKGLIFFNKKLYESAHDSLNRSIERNSNFNASKHLKGLTIMELYGYDMVLEHFQVDIRESNNKVMENFYTATILCLLDECDASIVFFNKVIEITPLLPAIYEKGNALFKLEMYDDSIQCYNTVIDSGLAFYQAYLQKGRALYKLKKFKEAIIYLDKSTQYPKEIKNYIFDYKTNEIIDRLDKSFCLDTNENEVYLLICKAGLKIGNYSMALKKINIFIGKEPNDYIGYYLKGLTYLKMEYLDHAISNFNASIYLNENDSLAFYQKGVALMLKGICSYDSALKYLEIAYQLDPNNHEIVFLIKKISCILQLVEKDVLALENLYKCKLNIPIKEKRVKNKFEKKVIFYM